MDTDRWPRVSISVMEAEHPEGRRSGRDRDWTDPESAGMPVTYDQPPGIGPESAEDGLPLPGDHPVGSEERGVTQAEEARPDKVRERTARERPDLPEAPPDDSGGRLATGATDSGDDPTTGDWENDDAGLSAEEAAIHIDNP